jgi:hypothetical protein
MAVGIERSNRPVAASRLASITRQLLDASPLCAIATVNPGGSAHINTAYFAWSPEFDVVWLSEPRAKHSKNIRAHNSAAIAVFDSRQTWGRPDRGIQLFGHARETERGGNAEVVYAARFPAYEEAGVGAYRFYVLHPRRVKLFDEGALGTGVFVTAKVNAGGRLVWERTEVYRPRR